MALYHMCAGMLVHNCRFLSVCYLAVAQAVLDIKCQPDDPQLMASALNLLRCAILHSRAFLEPVQALLDLLVIMACSDTIIAVVKKAVLALLLQLVAISGCKVPRLGDRLISAYRGAHVPKELWAGLSRLEEFGCLTREDLAVLGVGKQPQ